MAICLREQRDDVIELLRRIGRQASARHLGGVRAQRRIQQLPCGAFGPLRERVELALDAVEARDLGIFIRRVRYWLGPFYGTRAAVFDGFNDGRRLEPLRPDFFSRQADGIGNEPFNAMAPATTSNHRANGVCPYAERRGDVGLRNAANAEFCANLCGMHGVSSSRRSAAF